MKEKITINLSEWEEGGIKKSQKISLGIMKLLSPVAVHTYIVPVY